MAAKSYHQGMAYKPRLYLLLLPAAQRVFLSSETSPAARGPSFAIPRHLSVTSHAAVLGNDLET